MQALQIVASGLYAPLPFANVDPDDIDWGTQSSIRLNGSQVRYVPKFLTAARSHFVKVRAEPEASNWRVTVNAYGRDVQGPVPETSFLL